LNAANEVAVSSFLEKRMRFPQIWQTVERVMNAHESIAQPELDEILQADQWARAEATRFVEELKR
jgi:1-deoxy-D-xylulose-5-phosphate reductoisomerase